MNEKFQAALRGENEGAPPIWFMRQAGRYHQHYQGLRKQYSFMELCKKPEVAAEVAMGPIMDFDFDVSILFSDLLFPLEAFGMGLEYGDKGPTLAWHLDHETFAKIPEGESVWKELLFQQEALKQTRQRLPENKSLIGFVGGPWTLFTYAVEGAHKGNLEKTKSLLSLFGPFCDKLVPLLKRNIELQLEGGAEVVMVFDTAAGELSPRLYKEVCAPVLDDLAKTFPHRLGYYSKGTSSAHLDPWIYMEQSPWAGLGFDHRWELPGILTRRGSGFSQGNFDQALLFLPEEEFKYELEAYLKTYLDQGAESRRAWVCGLGHGVLPKTPEKHVAYFVQRVREVFS